MEGNSIERIYICLPITTTLDTFGVWLGNFDQKQHYLCNMYEIKRSNRYILYKSNNTESMLIPDWYDAGFVFHIVTDIPIINHRYNYFLFSYGADEGYHHCRDLFPNDIEVCNPLFTMSLRVPYDIEIHFYKQLLNDEGV